MNIEKLKKYAANKIEAGKLVKAVTAFKNELKDKQQMHDITMSEHFKTLREPLIEQQKKTDEKQDRVIEQLKKNQLALTSGIQDIMTLVDRKWGFWLIDLGNFRKLGQDF